MTGTRRGKAHGGGHHMFRVLCRHHDCQETRAPDERYCRFHKPLYDKVVTSVISSTGIAAPSQEAKMTGRVSTSRRHLIHLEPRE